MDDVLLQEVTQESFTTTISEEIMTLDMTQTEIISDGITGPAGPAGPAGSGGGDDVAPTFPIVFAQTSSALAAGVSANLDCVAVANTKIGKVQQITLSSSAPCKWEIKKRTAGVDTALDIIFTSGFCGNSPTHEWEPPHRDYAELAGNLGGTAFFRVTATNLDGRNPANVYATFMFDEVDS